MTAFYITEAAKKIIGALGGGETTRFVGGCVRNALLEEAGGDIDLATKLHPEAVIAALAANGIKTVPTGLAHGTVTALCDGGVFEITTLRRDVETDGRRAVVDFTDDWREDAKRRDFTMNTLFADLSGHIYDPLGSGVADLRRGRIVFVGDPAQRLAEDGLRLLRFFRFHARYGRGRPDQAALKACGAARHRLDKLSKERVTQEVLGIAAAKKAPEAFSLMQQQGILKTFIARTYEPQKLTTLIKLQTNMDDVSIAARLIAVCGNSVLRKIETILCLPDKTIKAIEAMLAARKTLREFSTPSLQLSLYRHGRAATMQALYLNAAPLKAVKLVTQFDEPVFPLGGKDLLKAGFRPGPEMGQELAKLERRWIKAGFPYDFSL